MQGSSPKFTHSDPESGPRAQATGHMGKASGRARRGLNTQDVSAQIREGGEPGNKAHMNHRGDIRESNTLGKQAREPRPRRRYGGAGSFWTHPARLLPCRRHWQLTQKPLSPSPLFTLLLLFFAGPSPPAAPPLPASQPHTLPSSLEPVWATAATTLVPFLRWKWQQAHDMWHGSQLPLGPQEGGAVGHIFQTRKLGLRNEG